MENKNILLIIIVVLVIALVGLFVFLNLNQQEVEQDNPEGQQAEFIPEEDNPGSNEVIIPAPKKPEVTYSNEFNTLMSQLKTSEDIVDFVNNRIRYVPRDGNQAVSAEDLVESNSGGAQDLTAFTAYALHINGFISFSFVYEDQSNNRYYVVAFRDADLPKYIYFDNSGAHTVHHGWSFRDLKTKEEERLGIKISRYGTVSPTSLKLEPLEWIDSK